MTDVAKEAGVSQTTVSLVLHHADGARLSALTRKYPLQCRCAANCGHLRGLFDTRSPTAALLPTTEQNRFRVGA